VRRRRAPSSDKSLRPAILIFNPESRAISKDPKLLGTIVDLLRAHGIRAKIGIKTPDRAARHLAKAAVENKEELVIVAGGDGNVEDVASQLVGTKTALGILAVGTMNNVARSLGIPLDLNDACALLGAGSTQQIDVGNVVAGGKPQVDYFLETAGLGLSAIAFTASQAAKKGRFAGLPHAIRKLFDYKPGAVRVELDDGKSIEANSQLVTVSNAPLMGLIFLVAPAAKMDDGLLDIAIYDGMGKTELIDYFMSMRNGKRAVDAKVTFHQSRSVTIHCQAAPPVDSDTVAVPAKKTLKIDVLPQALTVIAGKDMGLNLTANSARSKIRNDASHGS